MEPVDGGGYDVTGRARGRRADRAGDPPLRRDVVVANGHHWDPRWPEPSFPGAETFPGEQMHAHYYRTPDGFADKRVLVLGIGNSASDIAVESSRVAAATYLAMRRGAHIVPKYLFGVPTDHLTDSPLARGPLGSSRSDGAMLRLAQGKVTDYGLPKPDHAVLHAHPTVSDDLLTRLGHGDITVRPNVDRFEGVKVFFTDGRAVEVDVVVYCTGYKVTFPFLDERVVPRRDNHVDLYRRVVHPDHPGLYFVGLIQPLGAIMPLAEAQSEWVADLVTGAAPLPTYDEMRRQIRDYDERLRKRYVASKRHTIQVDFHAYLAELVRERTGRTGAPHRHLGRPSPAGRAASLSRASGGSGGVRRSTGAAVLSRTTSSAGISTCVHGRLGAGAACSHRARSAAAAARPFASDVLPDRGQRGPHPARPAGCRRSRPPTGRRGPAARACSAARTTPCAMTSEKQSTRVGRGPRREQQPGGRRSRPRRRRAASRARPGVMPAGVSASSQPSIRCGPRTSMMDPRRPSARSDQARRTVRRGRRGHDRDAAVAEVDEVLGGARAPAAVVDVDAGTPSAGSWSMNTSGSRRRMSQSTAAGRPGRRSRPSRRPWRRRGPGRRRRAAAAVSSVRRQAGRRELLRDRAEERGRDLVVERVAQRLGEQDADGARWCRGPGRGRPGPARRTRAPSATRRGSVPQRGGELVGPGERVGDGHPADADLVGDRLQGHSGHARQRSRLRGGSRSSRTFRVSGPGCSGPARG